MSNTYRSVFKKPEWKRNLGDSVVDRTILKWMLWKQDVSCQMDLSGSGCGPVAGYCE
jgi:hypothetical protein